MQLDFFVTRTATLASSAYQSTNDLAPPRPGFTSHERRPSGLSEVSQFSAAHLDPSTTGQAVGESVLDYVIFDGEEDNRATSAEADLSQRVEKQGKIRRALSRKNRKSSKPFRHHQDSSEKTLYQPESPFSYPPALLQTPRSPLPNETDPSSYFLDRLANNASPSPSLSESEFDFHRRAENRYSDHSLHGLLADSQKQSSQHSDGKDGFKLDVFERDEEDLNIMAELTRTGRPDLGRTIDEEVQLCQGKMLVAC